MGNRIRQAAISKYNQINSKNGGKERSAAMKTGELVKALRQRGYIYKAGKFEKRYGK